MTLPHHFLLPQFNDRTDEYGGSLENRVRLTRELLEETREEVGDDCAIALRFAVDEMLGSDGMQAQEEGRAVVELLAELPDLWDVNVADWSNDSATTRFEPQRRLSNLIYRVRQTGDLQASCGRRAPDFSGFDGVTGQARASLISSARHDHPLPIRFFPTKSRKVASKKSANASAAISVFHPIRLGVPIRCTQNPTMGEEWRRKWHPEIIESRGKEEAALVVGSGPAGLECAMQLARRGYEVTLAEAKQELGGRVLQESGLAGLSAWKRVTDHRIYDLAATRECSAVHRQPFVNKRGGRVGHSERLSGHRRNMAARWSREIRVSGCFDGSKLSSL